MLSYDELDQAFDTLTGEDHQLKWVTVDTVLIVADRVEHRFGKINEDQLTKLKFALQAGPYRVSLEDIDRCLTVRNQIIDSRE